MKRLLTTFSLLFFGLTPASAGSMTLLGAGGTGAVTPPSDCSAFLPAAFNTSALYISWTTADGLGSFGMACLNGTTPVAASTLGTFTGSATPGSGGLVLNGGYFVFSNITWLVQSSGTIYTQLATASGSNSTQQFFNISDNTVATNVESLRLQLNGVRSSNIVAGVTTQLASGFGPTQTVSFKAAHSYTSGAQIIYVNGTNTSSAAASGSVSGLSTAIVGNQADFSITTQATILADAFFSTALNAGTSPTLQAITQ